jgi:CRP-like cAMP-binding protein
LGKKERLALLLILLNDKFNLKNHPVDNPAEITITRTDLAKYAGTTLENLIRMLNYFKTKKIIRVNNKSIIIERFDELLRYAEIPITH